MNRKTFFKKFFSVLFPFFLMLSICVLSISTTTEAGSYKPLPPSGKDEGYVNVSYQYNISTNSAGSYWRFDWGDGNITKWIKISEPNLTIYKNHSWSKPGEYEIRVKMKTSTIGESEWSSPKIVNISFPPDTDDDGISDIEDTDDDNDGIKDDNDVFPKDPEEWEDTDLDGIGDNEDIDDDNDGLNDTKEKNFGSNPKNKHDVRLINTNGKTFYLVDTDKDEKFDLLYNKCINKTTKLEINPKGQYLIDINADGNWDYLYSKESGLKEHWSLSDIPWLYVILAAAIIVIIIIAMLFKTGYLYIYYVDEDKEQKRK